MATESFESHRGYAVVVTVTPAKANAIGGMSRRYRVSWTVSSPRKPGNQIASFPEQLDFLSAKDAFRYGQNGAHTFIDSILSTPARRRVTGSSGQISDLPVF